MENIVGDISFKCKHDVLFSNFVKSCKGLHFTILTFQTLNLPLPCFLLSEADTLIKAITWYLWSWEIPANKTDFWKILQQIERAAILRSSDTEALNFQVRLNLIVAFRNGTLLLKLVYCCYFHLHLIRLIYLTIRKTK